MAWGNAVLSENQNDVEACLTERGYQADISICSRRVGSKKSRVATWRPRSGLRRPAASECSHSAR